LLYHFALKHRVIDTALEQLF